MQFDLTITIGNVLTLVTLVGGLVTIYFSMMRRIDALEIKMRLMWGAWKKRFNLIEDDAEPYKDNIW